MSDWVSSIQKIGMIMMMLVMDECGKIDSAGRYMYQTFNKIHLLFFKSPRTNKFIFQVTNML
jgi:hypothetical protein